MGVTQLKRMKRMDSTQQLPARGRVSGFMVLSAVIAKGITVSCEDGVAVIICQEDKSPVGDFKKTLVLPWTLGL